MTSRGSQWLDQQRWNETDEQRAERARFDKELRDLKQKYEAEEFELWRLHKAAMERLSRGASISDVDDAQSD